MDIANMRFELAGYTVTGTVVLAAVGVLTVLTATVVILRGARRRRAAAAAQAEAVAHHERMVAAYRDSVTTWHRRRDEFRGLLETARTGSAATAPEGSDLTQFYAALAAATPGPSRVELLRNISQNLNDHELRRPLVPTVPTPVEGLGRKSRVAAAEWYVARTSETESLKALVDQVVVMVPTQTALRRESAPEVAVAS